MKSKIFATALLSLVSFSAMAMPAQTESLMKSIATSGKLAEALQGEQNIQEIKISRNTNIRDVNVQNLCGQDVMSRSASVLNVEIVSIGTTHGSVKSATKYFSTPESAEELKLCNGQN
ncbi:MAG: hypothetical protein ABIR96_11915 [Bdellovibrionota bacterium]